MRPQLDRGALLHVAATIPGLAAWLATSYADLRSRPAWNSRGQPRYDVIPQPPELPSHPNPRLERPDRGRRVPRMWHLDELDAYRRGRG